MRIRSFCAFSAVAAAISLLAACGSRRVAITPEQRERARKVPVIRAIHMVTPPFLVTTPSDAAGLGWGSKAAVGGMTSSDTAKSAAAQQPKSGYPDVSLEMKTRILQALRQAGFVNFTVVDGPLARPPDVDEMDWYRTRYKSGLVLEIDVRGYQFHYMPFNWETYWMGMGGHARLVDAGESKVLWEDWCNVNGVTDSAFRVDVKDFEAESNARLKSVIKAGVRKCADELAGRFLGNPAS